MVEYTRGLLEFKKEFQYSAFEFASVLYVVVCVAVVRAADVVGMIESVAWLRAMQYCNWKSSGCNDV